MLSLKEKDLIFLYTLTHSYVWMVLSHLMFFHQFGEKGHGDLLNWPVEEEEHPHQEHVEEGGAQGGEGEGQGSGGDGEQDQGGVLEPLHEEREQDEVGEDGAAGPGDGEVGVLLHVHPVLQPHEQVPEGALGTEVL